MVPCLVTLTDLSTRHAGLAALAVLLVIDFAGLYLFHDLCLPWQFVHYSRSPVRKCNNVRYRYEGPDFWKSNSPDLNTFHHKIWDSECTRKKCRMWMIWGGIWLMCELDWNRALLTMPSTSGTHVSVTTFKLQEDILIIIQLYSHIICSTKILWTKISISSQTQFNT